MASTPTTFTYLHSTTGRMRIRVAAYRGDEQACCWMEETLVSRPGITRVSANSLTGSVLILFDAQRTDDRQVLAELGILGFSGDLIASTGTGSEPAPTFAEISTRVGTALGKELVKAALARAVGGSPASLLLFFL